MPFAIELFLDDSSGDAVRRVWQEVAEAGASAFMQQSGARPHVTIAVADEVDVPAGDRYLRQIASTTAPLPLRFDSIGIFPTDPAVLFLAPLVTPELLSVHARFHHGVATVISSPWAYYRPGRWIPHCTLAMDLAPEAIVPALAASRCLPFPLEGQLVEVGLVEFRPTKQLTAYPLTGNPRAGW